jgi:predicted nucleic acid-binding protein
MELSVFIDANVFIAVIAKGDTLHARAFRVLDVIKAEGLLPVTSNFVVSEVVTLISQRVGKESAISVAEALYRIDSPTVSIRVDEPIERKALEYLKAIPGKNVSFTDCTTLALMELFRIPYLATFDRHFKTFGRSFTILE